MKKLFKGFAVAALVLLISACGGSSSSLKDGTYQAAGTPSDTGWTSFLTFEVKDGKITEADYDGVNLLKGSKDTKATLAKAGKYDLKSDKGGWDAQSKAITDYLVEKQSFDDIKFAEDGTSDAISSASIHYSDIVDLLKDAKETGPVTKGELTDGVYYAAGKKDEKGYVATLGYFVKNGVILSAHVDGYEMKKVDGKEEKLFKTQNKEYDLKSDTGTYAEQTQAIDDYIVENQGFDVKVDDEGKTDAISKATIGVSEWVELFKAAK